jgi:glycosyltransferase involved in cell wall biosynthesis
VKVSVITVVFENHRFVGNAIESVLSQDYPDIEYIIVDGGSKDGTVEIIRSYGNRVSRVISEPDNGLYDALNKGIALSTGDIIGFLHSDDVYEDAHVITDMVNTFRATDPDGVYGDIVYTSKEDTSKVFRKWRSDTYKHGMFLNGWMPPHPSLFLKKEVYRKFGVFNLQFKTAADYEIMLRFIHKHRITLDYLPRTVVRMRVGGESNRSIRNRIKANLQDREAWKVNGLKPRFYTLWLKPIRKIMQFRFF